MHKLCNKKSILRNSNMRDLLSLQEDVQEIWCFEVHLWLRDETFKGPKLQGWMRFGQTCWRNLARLELWSPQLLNVVRSSGEVPLEWQTGIVVPIFSNKTRLFTYYMFTCIVSIELSHSLTYSCFVLFFLVKLFFSLCLLGFSCLQRWHICWRELCNIHVYLIKVSIQLQWYCRGIYW